MGRSGRACRSELPRQPAGRQQHQPLQLADQRRQSRSRTGISKASATRARWPASAATHFSPIQKPPGAQAMLTIPMIGWVAKLGANRAKLASFSQAKYGAQTGNDWQWFADAGNGVLKSTGQNVTGNDPNDANVPAGFRLSAALGAGAGQQMGHGVRRRAALLHSRQRAQHLALHPSRRASHRRDHGRNPRQDSGLRRQDQSRRSVRDGRRPGRMGLERISAQRLRSAIRQPARLELSAGPRRARQRGLSSLAAGSVARKAPSPPASGLSMFSAFITIRKAASSATTSPPSRSCCAIIPRDRCGIPTTSMKAGSTIRSN